MFFSKEINRWRNVKNLLLRKTDVLKTCRKSKFFGKKIWRNALAFKSKKVQDNSGKRLFWHYYLQLSFVYKIMFQISFNLFCSGDKRLLSEFLRKWGWFQEHNEHFPKFIGYKEKLRKKRHGFVDARAPLTTTLLSSCHWKTLVPFFLRKKRPEKVFLTLTVNYRKIAQKNKLCHLKQQ